ncbi:MAG TPA: DMT family transporter [Candidatus Limnocylindrales bacterium]|jgi:drug/metabolite transporter (DMT)-like permease
MSSSTDVRRGILLAAGTALISGVAVFLNSFGVKAVPDAAVYTTAKNLVAAAILVAASIALPGRLTWPAPRSRASAGLIAIAVIGGSVPFVLFFSGLAIATAPTAAFIHKTLFIWVALLAVPLLGERLGLMPIAALGVLLAGQMLVAPPTGVGIGPGELMIAAATALWSVEVIIAKRLLGTVPVRTVAVARMALGVLILAGYLVVAGKLGTIAAITTTGWLWIGVTGVLLAGYVGTWYAALREAPATAVTSILVVGAVVTGVLSAVSAGAVPVGAVVGGYLLIFVAVAGIAILAIGGRGRSEPRARAAS